MMDDNHTTTYFMSCGGNLKSIGLVLIILSVKLMS